LSEGGVPGKKKPFAWGSLKIPAKKNRKLNVDSHRRRKEKGIPQKKLKERLSPTKGGSRVFLSMHGKRKEKREETASRLRAQTSGRARFSRPGGPSPG